MYSPAKATDTAGQGGSPLPGPLPAPTVPEGDEDYWNALINERAAGEFLKLTAATMQAKRMRGDGPPYFRLSARCVRYRRADLRDWVDALVRTSTSDPGREAA